MKRRTKQYAVGQEAKRFSPSKYTITCKQYHVSSIITLIDPMYFFDTFKGKVLFSQSKNFEDSKILTQLTEERSNPIRKMCGERLLNVTHPRLCKKVLFQHHY